MQKISHFWAKMKKDPKCQLGHFCPEPFNCCLLTIKVNTVAVFKDSEQSFKIFVAYSRDLHGMPHSFGKCTLLTIEGIGNLVSYLQISCLQIKKLKESLSEIMNLICIILMRVQKMDVCLSTIKETKCSL